MAFNFWKSDKDNYIGGEDQPLVVADSGGVERAARFLKHPRVAGTSREHKVAFLESKGCAPADIDEALRLVEDDKDMSWAAGLEDDKKGLAHLATDGLFEETAVSARGGRTRHRRGERICISRIIRDIFLWLCTPPAITKGWN